MSTATSRARGASGSPTPSNDPPKGSLEWFEVVEKRAENLANLYEKATQAKAGATKVTGRNCARIIDELEATLDAIINEDPPSFDGLAFGGAPLPGASREVPPGARVALPLWMRRPRLALSCVELAEMPVELMGSA